MLQASRCSTEFLDSFQNCRKIEIPHARNLSLDFKMEFQHCLYFGFADNLSRNNASEPTRYANKFNFHISKFY